MKHLIALSALLLPAVASAFGPVPELLDPSGTDLDPSLFPGGALPIAVDPDGPDLVAQIVGGLPVEETRFREVVFLEMRGTNDQGRENAEGTCTGSLIHPEWVLTAAHCVDEQNGVRGLTADSVMVYFGSRADSPVRQVLASEILVHNDWDTDTDNRFIGDVALLKLDSPVEDVAVMPLNADRVTNEWLGTKVEFIGFGRVGTDLGGSGVKRSASVPLVGIDSYQINTRDGEHDTCQGDSGGPGVVFTRGGYVQVSITSYGSVPCGTGSWSMRVDHYLDWIRARVPAVQTSPATPPTFRCSHEVSPDDSDTIALGVVPLELKCQVSYAFPNEIRDIRWDWGDGTVETGTSLQPDHTFETGGNFTVSATFDYDVVKIDAEGSEYVETVSHTVARYAYVRACAEPEPVFTWEQTGPRRVQFINRTDLSSYGCIYGVQWDIFEGDDTSGSPIRSIVSWAPEITFDEPGSYTAVLNVGGLGGTSAAAIPVKVLSTRGEGCSHVGGGAVGGLGLLALLGLRRRRD